ncbi:MAG: tetratricopeptide repeat protein [Acidobacteria bacterium]|nr:tetratricopeptide repeat protein [Acidobacteriota bacterium]
MLVLPLSARELVVSREGTVLRAACGDEGPPLASLPEGQAVTLRFSFAGADERCYSVRAEIDGRTMNGYVEREALEGIEAVEQSRRDVSSAQLATTAVESIRVESRIPAPAPGAGPVAPGAMHEKLQAAADAFQAGRAHEVGPLLAGVPQDNLLAAVLRGSAFLRLTRPGEAQAALDPALRTHPDDPGLLGLAGVAAFQQDRTADAAKLLARSVKLRPNKALSDLLARIQTEQSADQSDDKTYGSRFILRYDGQALPDAAARALARELDGELPTISGRLGCQIQDRLTVVVQTMDDYRSGAGAPGWSGGHYDGRIHVALGSDHRMDARVRETISHELVHACLARRGEWPAWFQEGVAQYVSGRRLDPQDRAALAELNRDGKLPTTGALTGSWARLDPRTAQIAYTTALAAAQVMFQDMQDYGVRNLLSNPSTLPAVAAKLDQRLKDTLR